MSYLLIKELERILQEEFSQTVFRQPDNEPGDYISPNFFIGDIPLKRKNNNPDHNQKSPYPLITNQFMKGQDDEDGSLVTIKTLCGSYTAGDIESGEHDVYNMVFRCRRLVLENQILLKKYKLKLPLQWQFGDEDDRLAQPHPLYFGSITTKWSVPEIVYNMTPEEEVTIYGSGLKET